MGILLQDLRYGLRMLLRTPGVTAVAILSLAIGIGANTTIFSLVNALLLRPLPVASPERLANVHSKNSDGSSFHSFSYPDYVDYRDHNRVFDQLAAYTVNAYSLNTGGQSERIFGIVTTENFFSMMGIQPAAGRFYTAEENSGQSGEPVAVLSNGYWRRRFGGDTSVVGRTLNLNGHAYTVIGIAPPKFTGPRVAFAPDIYLPVWTQAIAIPNGAAWLENRNAGSLEVVGRLKPGLTVADAQADLNAIAVSLAEQYPESHRGKGVDVRPSNSGWGQMESPIMLFMTLLMAVVGMVLLIACANVAGMALSRATVRRREIAIRLAVGARRGRIIRQLLTENVLLFLAGGLAGVLVAAWAKDLLLAFKPPVPFTIELDLPLDWRVLGFTAAISLVSGLIFGLAPALQASRPDVLPALKDETLGRSFRRSRVLNFFVSGQVAVSLVLLVCTLLFLTSLRHARTLDPGFNTENVMNVGFDLEIQGYTEARGRQFYRQLLERLAATPGIESASFAQNVPLNGNNMQSGINVEGRDLPPGTRSFYTDFNVVSPNYLSSLGIPLIRGRDFNDRDTKESTQAAIINESMARKFWPGEEALGKRFFIGAISDGTPVEVVGIARDGKYRTLGESPIPYFYLSFEQYYRRRMTLHLRSAPGNAAGVLAEVRREVASMDASLPLLDVMPLEQAIGVSLLPLKIAATVAGILGFVGLALSAVGIFGVVSFSVAQRTREIGIRMALGAERAHVLRLVVGQGVRLSLVGIVFGLFVSLAATRVLSSLLYGVSATDSITFMISGLLLLVVALIASYIPARRAARVDPMEALRYE